MCEILFASTLLWVSYIMNLNKPRHVGKRYICLNKVVWLWKAVLFYLNDPQNLAIAVITDRNSKTWKYLYCVSSMCKVLHMDWFFLKSCKERKLPLLQLRAADCLRPPIEFMAEAGFDPEKSWSAHQLHNQTLHQLIIGADGKLKQQEYVWSSGMKALSLDNDLLDCAFVLLNIF